MSKRAGLSLQTLTDRLGRPAGRRVQLGSSRHNHVFHMMWFCNGANAAACFAAAAAEDTPMPPGLTRWEQELFDHAQFPKYNWTLRPCPQHRNAFADYPEEPD